MLVSLVRSTQTPLQSVPASQTTAPEVLDPVVEPVEPREPVVPVVPALVVPMLPDEPRLLAAALVVAEVVVPTDPAVTPDVPAPAVVAVAVVPLLTEVAAELAPEAEPPVETPPVVPLVLVWEHAAAKPKATRNTLPDSDRSALTRLQDYHGPPTECDERLDASRGLTPRTR